MLTFVHRVDPSNLGDSVCCPMDYFDWSFTEHRLLDIHKPFPSGSHYIFGGGGLLHGDWLERMDVFTANRNDGDKAIVWSAGMNEHCQKRLIWPKFLDRFEMVGLRDWGNPWQYLPCVSCLHPAFASARGMEPKHDIVVYQHRERKIDIPYGFPGMTNEVPKESMREALEFISSGRVIVTNTFHGVYWSLLTGRVPLIFSPFSNRFFSFKPHLEICEWYNWKEAVEVCLGKLPDMDYYRECVTLNLDFFEGVKKLLA